LRSLDKDVALKSLGDYQALHPANKLVKKQYAVLLLALANCPGPPPYMNNWFATIRLMPCRLTICLGWCQG